MCGRYGKSPSARCDVVERASGLRLVDAVRFLGTADIKAGEWGRKAVLGLSGDMLCACRRASL